MNMRAENHNCEKKFRRAIELLSRGKLEEAEIELTAVLSVESDKVDALSSLALIKIYMANYQEAISLLGEAIRLNPEIARIHFLMSLALAKLHRLDEAEQFFLSGIELDPHDDAIPRFQSAIAMEKGNIDKALMELSSYVLENPEQTWDVWNELGTLYYMDQQFEYAKQSFSQSIRSAASMGLNIPFVHYNLGLCFNAAGKYDDAKEQFSIALELDSQLAPAWSALGILVAAEGEYEKAIDYINHSIELEPEVPSHWIAMGQVYELFGDKQSATHYFTQAYRAYRSYFPDSNVPEGSGGQA
ncbi:hypothetical protein DRQ33_01830 [bacterium]|nr:MAG: hypothetical protein DRQ33_01830 [bacterium]